MIEGLSSQSLGSLASPAIRLGAYVLDVVLHGFAIVIIISITGISIATAVVSGSAEGMGLGASLASCWSSATSSKCSCCGRVAPRLGRRSSGCESFERIGLPRGYRSC